MSIEYIGSADTEHTRTCGTCRVEKPVSEFYKDGKDSAGKIRYRRDCKECYVETRLQEAALKVKKGGKVNGK